MFLPFLAFSNFCAGCGSRPSVTPAFSRLCPPPLLTHVSCSGSRQIYCVLKIYSWTKSSSWNHCSISALTQPFGPPWISVMAAECCGISVIPRFKAAAAVALLVKTAPSRSALGLRAPLLHLVRFVVGCYSPSPPTHSAASDPVGDFEKNIWCCGAAGLRRRWRELEGNAEAELTCTKTHITNNPKSILFLSRDSPYPRKCDVTSFVASFCC